MYMCGRRWWYREGGATHKLQQTGLDVAWLSALTSSRQSNVIRGLNSPSLLSSPARRDMLGRLNEGRTRRLNGVLLCEPKWAARGTLLQGTHRETS
jgi:hypothetical protein